MVRGILEVEIQSISTSNRGVFHRLLRVTKAWVSLSFYHGKRFLGSTPRLSVDGGTPFTFRAHVNGDGPVTVYRDKRFGFGTSSCVIPIESETDAVLKEIMLSGHFGLSMIRLCCKVKITDIFHYEPSLPVPYFPERTGNDICMYTDAAGEPNAWLDISRAINDAKHFIYICAWSLDLSQRLVRTDQNTPSLGVQLMNKAGQGVRVLVLLWDAPGVFIDNGDEEVRHFFRHTEGVRVILAKRRGRGLRLLNNASLFTHHQKTIVADCTNRSGGQTRSLVAFLGGLDLTRGRYDDTRHAPFSTIHTVHAHDFHQNTIPGATSLSGAPRLPWHDVHCRLIGPAAVDVLSNFSERWTAEVADLTGMSCLTNHRFYRNLMNELLSCAMNFEFDPVSKPWNVQVVRSIDASSAVFNRDIQLQLNNKGNVCETTTHQAYVNAIRGAQRFIYIEQQYFISSAQNWRRTGTNAHNIIAIEIASQIIRHIRAKRRFHVYIIIPLHPDGDPTTTVIQGIMAMQAETISVICRKVGEEIGPNHDLGSSSIPYNPIPYCTTFGDPDIGKYVSLMCLGRKERMSSNNYEFTAQPFTVEAAMQISRRSMIYVHSKMMIVDDRVIVMGSGNINERSMNGGRDTELGIIASQSLKNGKLKCKGAIRAFRKKLWKEHTLMDFDNIAPESAECILKMRRISDDNWRCYQSSALPKHNQSIGKLMTFPFMLLTHGAVSRPQQTFVPDRPPTAHFMGTFPTSPLIANFVS